MKSFSPISWLDFVWLGIIAIAHYIQVRLYVGPVEDMIYQYVSSPDGPLFDNPISSLHDAFLSQCNDYFYVNGRFLNHVVVQYLCGMSWGKEFFFVLDSLFFAGIILGIVVLIRDYCEKTFADIWVVLFLLIWLSPHQGLTLLGHIAFGVNYVWGGCSSLWFFILWKYCQKNELHRFLRPIIVLASLMVGSLHEGFSLPISAGLFLYYALDYRRFRGFGAWIAVAFWIGTCFVTFAPANFVRFHALSAARVEENVPLIYKALRMAKNLLFGSRAVDIFTALCIVGVFPKYKGFIKQHIAEIMVPAVVIAFAMFVAWADVHQLMPLVFFVIVLVCSFVYNLLDFRQHILSIIVGIVIVVSIIPGYFEVYRDRVILKERWDCFFDQSKNVTLDYCNAKEILTFCNDVNSSYVGYTDIGYCTMQLKGNRYLEQITLAEFRNDHAIQKTAVLPDAKEVIMRGCVEENAINDSVYILGNLHIKVMPLDSTSSDPHSFVADNMRYTVLY